MDAIKQRDYYFDNLKFLLIALVVTARMISPLQNFSFINVLHSYIYVFHMPLFIFVSGYFAKFALSNGRHKNNKILNYILLYVILQIIWTILAGAKFSLFSAQFGLWYVQVLIIYYFILPVIDKFKPYYLMPIAIVLGILIGFDIKAGHAFSASRSIVFLPFFMAGYYCRKEQIAKLFKPKYRLAAGLIAAAVLMFVCIYYKKIPFELLEAKASYAAMDIEPTIYGAVMRAVWYIISGAMCISFLCFIPNKKTFFSAFGSRTMQVYVLHLLVFGFMKKTEVFTYFNSTTGIAAIFIFSILLVFVLSSRWLEKTFNIILKYNFFRVLKR